MAVGTYGVSSTGGPAVVRSTDGGVTWSVPAIPVSGVQDMLGVSCTGTGASAVCAAGGMDLSTASSFLLVSTDGGASWQNRTLDIAMICYGGVICYPQSPTVPPAGTPTSLYTVVLQSAQAASALTGVSCVGTAPNVSCYAAGASYAGLDHPLVFVSNDDTLTNWIAAPIAMTDRKLLDAIGCAAVNASITCVATGHFIDPTGSAQAPTIDVSMDGGATWASLNSPTPPYVSAQYTTVSSTGSGSSIVWTLSGTAWSPATGGINISATSTDGGASWH